MRTSKPLLFQLPLLITAIAVVIVVIWVATWQYVQQMLTLAGWPKPADNAKAIVDFETRLAEVQWTRIERRDRDAVQRRRAGTPSWAST